MHMSRPRWGPQGGQASRMRCSGCEEATEKTRFCKSENSDPMHSAHGLLWSVAWATRRRRPTQRGDAGERSVEQAGPRAVLARFWFARRNVCKGRATLLPLLAFLASLPVAGSNELRMAGDLWPMMVGGGGTRSAELMTIREAFEEHEADTARLPTWKSMGAFDKGIHCAGYDDVKRDNFRRVQEAILERGIATTFSEWDGIDDSIPDAKLNWRELRMGFRRLVFFDAFGKQVILSVQDIEMLIREMTDDDTDEFIASEWGSSFYRTDGSSEEALAKHYKGQPKTLRDGGTDNVMCTSEAGKDLEICGFVDLQGFTKTVNQKADMKYSENCNGHGVCDLSVGVCHCQPGWSGFNCSEPDKPCSGVTTLKQSYGSFTDGYGVGRVYGHKLNCTWIIEPEHHDTYGLPMMFTFVFFNMEVGFDAVDLYEAPYVDIQFKLKAMGVGGTFPKDRWAMPHSIVVGNGKKIAINFGTDDANPSGLYYGFKILFGRLDLKYLKALSYPLLAPGCNRKFSAEDPRCLDRGCTNCGVTLDEDTDDAIFMGSPENMCFSSFQPSNATAFNVSQDYYVCDEALRKLWLTFTVGDLITTRTPCNRGLMKPVTPKTFVYDRPEFILGSGPPEMKIPALEEGQAFQRGYITSDWWASCSLNCQGQKRAENYDNIFEDVAGKPGPIFAAQIVAMNTSRASKFQAARVQRPKSRITGLQYGMDGVQDNRTMAEKNSMALKELFQDVKFTRFTSFNPPTGVEIKIGEEYCEFQFRPTMPGIYRINFFELRKDRYFDNYMQAVPFPDGAEHRTAVVMPGKTSAPHSKAFGMGLDYYSTTRTGIGVTFRIDSYDTFDNLRLSGGDQYIVTLVHEQKEAYSYGEVSNLGNGSYHVSYNVTLSGRYVVHVTLPSSSPTDCPDPNKVSLTKTSSRQLTGLRCDIGTAFTIAKNGTDGTIFPSNKTGGIGPVRWCTPPPSKAAVEAGEENCVEYSHQTTDLAWVPFKSPFHVWVDSGQITPASVEAFGSGLSVAIAHYPAFFMLRIRDVFGNWASSQEKITTAFVVPRVDQTMFEGYGTPTSSALIFAGNEVFQGDYYVEWEPLIAGEHKIMVMLCNPACVHISGSPFTSEVYPAPTYGPNSTVEGNGIMDGFAGHPRSFTIEDRDSAMNRRHDGGEDFQVLLDGLSLADCPVIQNQVILDVVRKCPALYSASILPCTEVALQYLPGPEVSANIQPSLTCMYRRNVADCLSGCCPNGTADACSEFDHDNTRSGFAPRSTRCETRVCAFPSNCKFAMKALQQAKLGGSQNLLKTFFDASHYSCPQIERLGLEARLLAPPDRRQDKQYNVIAPNLDPDRPFWKGPMSIPEIEEWVSLNFDRLPFLYYNQTKNSVGNPYFGEYGPATGYKSGVEGFVMEEASTQGRRTTKTSMSPISASLHPSEKNMIGNFSLTDNDDGSYRVTFNITRAGLYSLSVSHGGLMLEGAPFHFIIRPEIFDAKTCIVNGTGISKDKDTHTGVSDYKGNQIAGKLVAFDISLRDTFWNYIWASKPESDFKIYLDPMRIRYYDTTDRIENIRYWPVAFDKYTFHDYGDANYKIDYRVTTAGTFPINVRLKSPGGAFVHLDRSPYMIMVRPDVVNISASTAYGGGLTLCGAGLICTFAVETRDRWGNRRVLAGDEGPYCHTWNANVNNGGSGGNQWRTIFPSDGCAAGAECSEKWIRWANTMPASGYVVDGPEEPQDFPAHNNEVAYHARGGILHDCVPLPPFATEEEYNQQPSCVTSRQGPCGRFDEWGRLDKKIWTGEDGEMFSWDEYRAKYADQRPHYTAFIDGAIPAKYERFDVFIDSDNMYSGNYNITKGGIFKLSVVYIDVQSGSFLHIRGSPFKLKVTGGLTDPLRSSAEGHGLESAAVGYPSTFSVFARDRFKNRRSLGREIVQVFIQPTNFGYGRIPALVHDRLDGSYYVEYNATIAGQYTLSVSLLGHDIPGSPFKIQVTKGFNFPHFNSTWGFNLAGSAYFQPQQGHVFCWGGQPGCVSRIQLNIEDKDSVGAAWFDTMQKVSRGFETQFSFSITGLSRHCKTDVILEDRCMSRGGDGFAFVIHDNGFTHALGAGASSMGYGGIDNSIAFEFDTWYNSELGDVYQNHVAVHTMGTEKNTPSSRSRLVSTSDIPNLSDGNVHTVRMRYEPWTDADTLLDTSYGISPYSLQWITSGAGGLRLWIDDLDRPVLTFPLNLRSILALTEDRAYIGFTAATGAAHQSHYIHSWSFVDTVCLNDCNDRGSCIDGICYCEEQFSGEDCRIGAVEKQHKDVFLCPTQNQKPDSTIASGNCSCPAGSYGPIGGPCEACPIDTWKTEPGDSECLVCPPNSDTGGKAAVQDRGDCRCKAGYIGTDGGPCLPVPEDTYKIGVGTDQNETIPCPPNSGTVFRQARSNVLDCLCKPGYQGPNGGPCLVCPTESYKASWGDATCESQCPPFSETFGCSGPGGNTGCVSSWQCVCKAGYYGRPCLPESPQYVAGRTCTPCVRTKFGPMDKDYENNIVPTQIGKNPLFYSQRREDFYTIPLADQREGVEVPPKKKPPAEYGTDGKP